MLWGGAGGGFGFLLDVAKGFAPVLLCGIFMGYADAPDEADAWRWLAVAVAAVLGHVFPVWLGFRGGKGVATGLGGVLGFWPMLTVPAVASGLTWMVLVGLFRYVSLASVVAAIGLPLFIIAVSIWEERPLVASRPFLIVTALIALLVLVRHRENLQRIRAGTESRIGRRRQEGSSPSPR